MNDTTAIRHIGQPLRRREDLKLLAGKGRYVDDVRLPGMLHMAILRSPHAHAQINSVDLSAAKVAPGVRLVLSGKALVGTRPYDPNVTPSADSADRPKRHVVEMTHISPGVTR